MPTPDGDDRVPSADLEGATGERVLGPNAEDPARLVPEEVHGSSPRRDRRAVGGGRAGDVDGEERVVLLGVVELHRPDQRIGPKRRRRGQRGAMGEVPRPREVPARPGVVEEQAGPDVRALPAPVLQGEEELDRPHEVGREPGQEQAPLAQGLADEPELEHLEVAQPAVDQLARAARRAHGQVPRLDQPDAEAPRRRVERAADAGDPAADDEDVDSLSRQAGDGLRPRVRAENAAGHESDRMWTSTASRQRALSRARPAESRLGATRRTTPGARDAPVEQPGRLPGQRWRCPGRSPPARR